MKQVIDWIGNWTMEYALYLVVTVAIALFAGFVFVVDQISHAVERRDCRVVATKMSLPWDYSSQTGCMVMIHHQWVPLGAVRRELP